MNVSLPNLAAHAMPAKTLPGAAMTATKFSTALAEAQDTADSPMPDVMSAGEKQNPKPMPAKSEKSAAKSSVLQASSTFPKAAFVITPATPEGKSALSSFLPFGTIPSPMETPQADDSDAHSDLQPNSLSDSGSVRALPFQLALTTAGVLATSSADTTSTSHASNLPGAASQLESKKTHSPDPAADNQADNQLVEVSSTDLLGTGAGREEDTNFKSLVAPGVGNPESPATPTGKPANAATKPASREAGLSTTSTLDSKSQTGLTVSQSHAALSTTPAPVRPDPSKGQQEKAVTSAPAETNKSDTPKKDVAGAGDETTAPSKGNSSLPGAALAGNNSAPANAPSAGTTAGAATTPASAVSLQVSTPGAVNPAGNAGAFTKTSSVLPHTPSTAATEDVEATAEAAALSANSPLHTAKLLAGMEQSELRVGLRAGEFGNVDIRTSLVRNQFTAEISVERGELGRALAAELPSLQHRLTEQHLPAADIKVQHYSSGSSSEFQQESRPGHRPLPVSTSGGREQQDAALPVLPVEAMEATAGLDIHM